MRRGEDMARRCGILDSRTLCKIAGVSMLVSTLLQSMADPDSVKKEENVYLFVPNIIGYVRIALIFLSLYVMLTHPWLACSAYFLSVLLDELDGTAARRLNQCTTYGAILDVVTDRCGVAGLLAGLGHLYPSYLFLFQCLIILEISSPWVHMLACLYDGTSYKVKLDDPTANPLLKFYYRPRVLSVFWNGNGVFMVSVYMLHFMPEFYTISVFGREVGLWQLLVAIFLPISLVKQCFHALQLVLAFQKLARLDTSKRAEKSS